MSTEKPIAVVTGAAGGIGGATVRSLQGHGFHVIGVDITPGAPGDESRSIDFRSPICGDEVLAALDGRPMQGLVNNAAVAVYRSIEDTTLDEWNEVLDVNLRAAFLVSKALFRSMEAAGGGAIVNVSSVHAEATSMGIAAYAASKGGLLALTRAMALEWAPLGVRVNTVLPGAVDTAMLDRGLFRSGATIESLGARHPVGRVGHIDEVAHVISFLLSPEASFVTGTSIRADGGALARLGTE